MLAVGLVEKAFVTVLLLVMGALLLIAPRNKRYIAPRGWISYETPRTTVDRFTRPYGAETVRVYFFRPDGRWRRWAKTLMVALMVITVAAIWIFA